MALIKCPECDQQFSEDALVCLKCGFRRFKPNDSDQRTRRNLSETEVTNDWKKSIDHLLRDIHEESLDKTRPESETVSRTLARFAALLARLSRDADVTADKNLKLQTDVRDLTIHLRRLTQWLFWLTIAIGFLTLIQALSSGNSLLKEFKSFKNVPKSQSTPNQNPKAP